MLLGRVKAKRYFTKLQVTISGGGVGTLWVTLHMPLKDPPERCPGGGGGLLAALTSGKVLPLTGVKHRKLFLACPAIIGNNIAKKHGRNLLSASARSAGGRFFSSRGDLAPSRGGGKVCPVASWLQPVEIPVSGPLLPLSPSQRCRPHSPCTSASCSSRATGAGQPAKAFGPGQRPPSQSPAGIYTSPQGASGER